MPMSLDQGKRNFEFSHFSYGQPFQTPYKNCVQEKSSSGCLLVIGSILLNLCFFDIFDMLLQQDGSDPAV